MGKNTVAPAKSGWKVTNSTSKDTHLISTNDPFFTSAPNQHSPKDIKQRPGRNKGAFSGKKENSTANNKKIQHHENPKFFYGKNLKNYNSTSSDYNNTSAIAKLKKNLNEGNGESFQKSKNVEEKSSNNKLKGGKVEKKTFDKKKWRLQKYSKKYKLEQWEDIRKKSVLREYYNQLKHDDGKSKFDVKKIYEQYDSDEEHQEVKPTNQDDEEKDVTVNSINSNNPKDKNRPHRKAREEFERFKQEKLVQKEEFLKRKTEKEQALKLYKQKKNEKYKRLGKKTKKGQPVMKDRIEMLLEKIQSSQ